MEMTLRWYGSKFDTVTLQQIRQIPAAPGAEVHAGVQFMAAVGTK